MYYTITTITTVGYGDISGVTPLEKFLCIIIMLIGVITFSFASGALASIFASYDKTNAKLEEQMEMLDTLSAKYDIPLDLYSVIKQSLTHKFGKEVDDINELLDAIPYNVRIDVTNLMYK